jgi:hypothetical protein
MARTGLTALFLGTALLLSACADEPGGSIQFTISGADDLPADLQGDVGITWDGENPYTRELACALDSSVSTPAWSLRAVDRSVGNGLLVVVQVLDYDGPRTYTRDRFQPESPLSIDYEEAETEVRTAVDVAAGGSCEITIEEGSKSGSFACTDVPLGVDAVDAPLVGVAGTFLCSTLDSVQEGRPDGRGRGDRYF